MTAWHEGACRRRAILARIAAASRRRSGRTGSRSAACRSATPGGIRAIKRADATNGLMPLHKLSQWLTYSLIEPLQRAGIAVTDIDGLTGLAEYRNGGLFVDAGVIALRDPEAAGAVATPSTPTLVVEWRALTVALLDRLAPLVRERARRDDGALSRSARVLEGGTWAAGRKIAQANARGRRPAAHGHQRRHGLLRSSHEGRHHRRSPAGAAQADAAARQDALDQGVPRAVQRDRRPALLRGDARPAAGKGRDRNAVRQDDVAGARRQEAGAGAGRPRRHGLSRRHAQAGAVGARRPCRALPRSAHAGGGRIFLQGARRHGRAHRCWCCTRCSPPAIRRSPPSTG